MWMRLALAKGAHVALSKQTQVDAALLARMGIMDYSLHMDVGIVTVLSHIMSATLCRTWMWTCDWRSQRVHM